MTTNPLMANRTSILAIPVLILWLLFLPSVQAVELTEKIEICAGCHGDNGLPAQKDIPIISGQEYYYLYVQLKDYKAGRRDAAVAQSAATSGMCVQCHLGGYEGSSRVPRLAGQQVAYLERTMLEFKNKIRMNAQAKGSLFATYGDEDIAAMARYLAGR
jgi:cytochrome c553